MEVLHPRHHGRLAQPVARRPAGVVLDVQHARQRDAVAAPAAPVLDEVRGLRGAGAGVRVREVVAAADEAGVGRARVVAAEAGVDVVGAFGGFDDDEARPGAVGGAEVDVGLVVGDVEALDGGAFGEQRRGGRECKREGVAEDGVGLHFGG